MIQKRETVGPRRTCTGKADQDIFYINKRDLHEKMSNDMKNQGDIAGK
jgi:hypothetical protein